MSEKRTGKDRPFPWRCLECVDDTIVPVETDYRADVKHDGRLYSIHIGDLAIPTCRKCGKQLFSSKVDDRIVAALREVAGILTPEEIHRRRKELEFNQQELAEQLGVAKETISRWESG